MKIAFVPEVTSSGDAVRGIGVHTTELLKYLKNSKNSSLKVTSYAEAEIIHFTVFRLFLNNNIPLFKPENKKIIITIHDLVPLLYPDHYPPGLLGNVRFWINKYLVKRNVDTVLTISETSKKDICRLLSIDPEKVFVTYLGYKKEHRSLSSNDKILKEVKEKYNLPNKFVFYFGDINYNKNLPTLFKACERIGIPLVIAGKHALEVDKLDLNHPEHNHLKEIDFKKTIRLGFISDEDANAVLNLATCLVQPSLYEGFGLSVVHAFAAGCPVIASRTNCLVEIGGDACLYFDPNDVDDLIDNMERIAEDQKIRKSLIKKGFKRLKYFSWTKCAKETIKVYKKVLAGN